MQQALPSSNNPHHERRWLILGVIALAQLMVVLDVTVVNIALPSAQADLGFSDESRQWVITAYALAFGSLLLLGGADQRPDRPQVPSYRASWSWASGSA